MRAVSLGVCNPRCASRSYRIGDALLYVKYPEIRLTDTVAEYLSAARPR